MSILFLRSILETKRLFKIIKEESSSNKVESRRMYRTTSILLSNVIPTQMYLHSTFPLKYIDVERFMVYLNFTRSLLCVPILKLRSGKSVAYHSSERSQYRKRGSTRWWGNFRENMADWFALRSSGNSGALSYFTAE